MPKYKAIVTTVVTIPDIEAKTKDDALEVAVNKYKLEGQNYLSTAKQNIKVKRDREGVSK